jgi:DNA polymerase-3 subunit epsilon
MVKTAPKFFEVAKEIVEFTNECVFVAHNVGFDYKIVRQEFLRLGFDYRREHLCTVRASRHLLPGHASYSLGNLSDDLGIVIHGRHRAGGDALATAQLFTLLQKAHPQGVEGFIQKEINPKSLHPGLDLNTIDQIPARTGVYKLYNVQNEIIYIGKSKNIKSRVLQHLKNTKSKKAIELKEAIAKVDYELTGSELIALLLESELIKSVRPKFNRRLKKSKSVYGVYSFVDQRGYVNLYVDRCAKKEEKPLISFEQKREAVHYLENRVEAYQLCKKLVGLYPSSYSCFDYQIKKCAGACIGEESSEEYNKRVQLFLEKTQFENDCFFLVDKGRSRNEISLVLVEHGMYKGYGFISNKDEDQTIDHWLSCVEFKEEDRDAKQIIQSYIRNGKYKQIRGFDA